jgi:hypothetical protein
MVTRSKSAKRDLPAQNSYKASIRYQNLRSISGDLQSGNPALTAFFIPMVSYLLDKKAEAEEFSRSDFLSGDLPKSKPCNRTRCKHSGSSVGSPGDSEPLLTPSRIVVPSDVGECRTRENRMPPSKSRTFKYNIAADGISEEVMAQNVHSYLGRDANYEPKYNKDVRALCISNIKCPTEMAC